MNQKIQTDISVGQMFAIDKDNNVLLPVDGKVELSAGETYTLKIPVLNQATAVFPSQEIPVTPPLGVCFKTYLNSMQGMTFDLSQLKADNPDFDVYMRDSNSAWFYQNKTIPADYIGEITAVAMVVKTGTFVVCQLLVSNNNNGFILADTDFRDNSTNLQY